MIGASQVRSRNSGRNILDGPGYVGLKLSLSKQFRCAKAIRRSSGRKASASQITPTSGYRR
jgi:hypothetical protein